MSWVQAGEGHRPCRPPRGTSLHGTSAARRAIESVVAAVFEVDARELQARSRIGANGIRPPSGDVPRACGVRHQPDGCWRPLRRDRTTVSHACSLVEDKRDDPDLDCRLDHLEQAISCLIDALSPRRGSR